MRNEQRIAAFLARFPEAGTAQVQAWADHPALERLPQDDLIHALACPEFHLPTYLRLAGESGAATHEEVLEELLHDVFAAATEEADVIQAALRFADHFDLPAPHHFDRQRKTRL